MTLECPYVGLIPYEEKHADYFFGRKTSVDVIINNLMASRLTILSGASGVGKSSVLQAGVACELCRRQSYNLKNTGIPGLAVIVFNTWKDNPLDALKRAVEEKVKGIFEVKSPESDSPVSSKTFRKLDKSESFSHSLQYWTECLGFKDRPGELFIILDQFEEYFRYHCNEEDDDPFRLQFPEAVNQIGLDVNFLISIRQDHIYELDAFQGKIPKSLLNNRLYLKHLDVESARSAIEKPVDKYNQDTGRTIEIDENLTSQVLKDLVGSNDERRQGESQRVISKNQSKAKISTPYLQLVMVAIWKEEMRLGSKRLRLKTYEKLGREKDIVDRHFARLMQLLPRRSRKDAQKVFNELITPSGAKIALCVYDLHKRTKISRNRIFELLEQMSKPEFRILHSVGITRSPEQKLYEIYHDALGKAITNWLDRCKEVRIKFFKGWASFLGTTSAIAIAIAFYNGAWNERKAGFANRLGLSSEEAWTTFRTDSQSRALSYLLSQTSSAKDELFTSFPNIWPNTLTDDDYPTNYRLSLSRIVNTIREKELIQVSDRQIRVANITGTDNEHEITFIQAFSPGEGYLRAGYFNVNLQSSSNNNATPDSPDDDTSWFDLSFSAIPRNIIISSDGQQIIAIPEDSNTDQAEDSSIVLDFWDLSDGISKPSEQDSPELDNRLIGYSTLTLDKVQQYEDIFGLILIPDSQLFATALENGNVIVGDSEKPQRDDLEGHESRVLSIAYSSDSESDSGTYVTGSEDGTALVWQVNNKTPEIVSTLEEVEGPDNPVLSVDLDSTNKYVVTGLFDGQVRFWSYDDDEDEEDEEDRRTDLGTIPPPSDVPTQIWRVEFGPDNNSLITASRNSEFQNHTIRHYYLQEQEENGNILSNLRHEFVLPTRHNLLDFSFNNSDLTSLATVFSDGTFRRFSIEDSDASVDIYPRTNGQTSPLVDTAFCSDDRILATANNSSENPPEGLIRLRNLRGDEVEPINNDVRTEQLSKIVFDPDCEQMIAISSSDNDASPPNNVSIWKLEDDRLISVVKDSLSADVLDVGFSSDNQPIAITSATNSDNSESNNAVNIIYLLDDRRFDLEGTRESVENVAISPNGQKIATSSANGIIQIWDLEGKFLSNCNGDGIAITSLIFSPDSKYIATSSANGTIRIRDLQDFSEDPISEPSNLGQRDSDRPCQGQVVLDRDERDFTKLAFSSDEQFFAATTSIGSTLVWQRQSQQPEEFTLVNEFTYSNERIVEIFFDTYDGEDCLTLVSSNTMFIRRRPIEDISELIARGYRYLQEESASNETD